MNAIDIWIETRRELRGRIYGLKELCDQVSNAQALLTMRSCNSPQRIFKPDYSPSPRIFRAIVDEIKAKIDQLQQELDEHEKRVSIS